MRAEEIDGLVQGTMRALERCEVVTLAWANRRLENFEAFVRAQTE
jgi:hypothetical protein